MDAPGLVGHCTRTLIHRFSTPRGFPARPGRHSSQAARSQTQRELFPSSLPYSSGTQQRSTRPRYVQTLEPRPALLQGRRPRRDLEISSLHTQNCSRGLGRCADEVIACCVRACPDGHPRHCPSSLSCTATREHIDMITSLWNSPASVPCAFREIGTVGPHVEYLIQPHWQGEASSCNSMRGTPRNNLSMLTFNCKGYVRTLRLRRSSQARSTDTVIYCDR